LIALLALLFGPAQAAQEARGIRVVARDGATGEEREVPLYSKTHAVVIGIDRYPGLPYDRQLSFAVKDAKGVEQCLRDHFRFERIVTLYNEEATKEGILRVLLGDMGATGKEDGIFVFFAGHGMTERTGYGDLGYIVPHNGTLDPGRLDRNISMTLIKEDISKKIPAKHIFYVFDACYSGLLLAGRGTERATGRSYDYLMEITKEPVRQVLTAGDRDQVVLDGGPRGHSVFTGRLIEALESADDFLTASELATIVKERVYSDAKSRGHRQTPKDGELFGMGDFVFVPAIDKKAAALGEEVNKAEAELRKLEALEKRAAAAADEKERARIELERKQAKARLKAEQLKLERIEEERARREQEAAERAQKEAMQREAKAVEEARLEVLRLEVQRKREALDGLSDTGFTPEETMAEMGRVKTQIEEIKSAIRSEKDKALAEADSFYYERLASLSRGEKDMFETQAEFEARIESGRAKVRSEKDAKTSSIKTRYDKEITGQIAPFRSRLRSLASREFTATGDQVKVDLQDYNAEGRYFPVVLTGNVGDKSLVAGGVIALEPSTAKALWADREFLRGEIRHTISQWSLAPWIKDSTVVDDAAGSRYALKLSGMEDRDPSRFHVAGDGTVIDHKLGVMWATADNGDDISWDNAKAYCDRLTLAGYDDWRLPTLDELKSLYKAKVTTYQVRAKGIIRITETDRAQPWASKLKTSSHAWKFNFYGGSIDSCRRTCTGSHRAMPVRSLR